MSGAPSALLALALLVEPAPRDSPAGFYLGVLMRGARELDVALELRDDDTGLSGSYFYFGRSQQSLTLRGSLEAGELRLEEKAPDGRVSGVWTGRPSSSGYAGVWTKPDSDARWSFRLSRSERATRYFAGAPRSADTGRHGPIAYALARVPASRHRVPLITSFGDARVISSVNATLMAAANGAHCESGEDDFAFDSEVSFVGGGLLSVRIVESWFCGAAYPTTAADRSIVFDLGSGQPLDRSRLFREDAPAEEIAGVVHAYELAQARAPSGALGEQEGCRQEWTRERLARAASAYYHLVPEGLVVRPDFPHAIEACANEVTVPYPALAPIVAPGGPLAPLVAARAGRPSVYRIHRPGTTERDDVRFTPPPR